MAGNYTSDELIEMHTQTKVYWTYKEATDFMRLLNNVPTGRRQMKWRNAHTGNEVVIGCVS